MQILRIALNCSHDANMLGSEMHLYLSVLVLWAITHARIHHFSRLLANSNIHGAEPISTSYAQTARDFARRFLDEVDTVYGPVDIPSLHQWLNGVVQCSVGLNCVFAATPMLSSGSCLMVLSACWKGSGSEAGKNVGLEQPSMFESLQFPRTSILVHCIRWPFVAAHSSFV